MAESISTLMSVNTENRVTASILQTITDQFEKMKVNENKKTEPDQQLLSYLQTSADLFKDCKGKFSNTDIENLKIKFKNHKYPALDEIQATCLAESLIKDSISSENNLENIKQRHEYLKETTPSTFNSEDQNITVNVHPHTRTADPAIFGTASQI